MNKCCRISRETLFYLSFFRSGHKRVGPIHYHIMKKNIKEFGKYWLLALTSYGTLR